MDEWLAKLSNRVHPKTEYSLQDQIYTMNLVHLGRLGLFFFCFKGESLRNSLRDL